MSSAGLSTAAGAGSGGGSFVVRVPPNMDSAAPITPTAPPRAAPSNSLFRSTAISHPFDR